MTKNICISGYYGFDNFGDETILKILVENLKKFQCNPKITVFSSNPEKTKQIYDVDSFYSFNIKDIISRLLKCDCLISGGGSLLQDVTSSKSLIYYLGILIFAQLFRKKTIIFAQGIGPINNKLLREVTAFVLNKAKYICVRDKKSLNLLKEWGINASLCPDPVWNINTNQHTNKTNKIGIQLRDYSTVHNAFITQLAFCINKYYKDKEIYILSLQNKLDSEICRKLQTRLISINPDLNVKVIENNSNSNIIETIETLDELIAMRYHACLIAIKSKVKLLPIDYDIKVEELANEFNLTYIDMIDWEKMTNTIENFINSNIVYNEDKINSLMFNFKQIEDNL